MYRISIFRKQKQNGVQNRNFMHISQQKLTGTMYALTAINCSHRLDNIMLLRIHYPLLEPNWSLTVYFHYM
jgi:hypothetical protein